MNMKLVSLTILCMLLFVSTISAELTFDNTLSYSNNDLKVEIKNTFGLGKTIGTVELKSHPTVDYLKVVEQGKQIVMWYDFDYFNLYQQGIENIEFTDVKTGKIIDRDYSFVYWDEEECILKFHINGTSYNDCVGGEWLSYNSLDIPLGKKTIGIEVDVQRKDYIDAVWTISGKRISRHSLFIAGDNESYGENDPVGDSSDFSINLTSNHTLGIISAVGVSRGAGTPDSIFRVDINQSGVTLASETFIVTDSIGVITYLNLSFANYSAGIEQEAFTIDIHRTTGGIAVSRNVKSFIGTLFNFTTQTVPNHIGTTFTFTAFTSSPSVNLTFPEDNASTLNTTVQFAALHNTSFRNLVNTTLIIWHPNGTVFNSNFTTITGITNSTYLSISDIPFANSYIWNHLTCLDEPSCEFDPSNFTFSVRQFIENSATFNNQTVEGSMESFSTNITIGDGLTATAAVLFYNGTPSTGSISVSGDNTILTIDDVEIPSVDSNTNVTFVWSVLLSDSSIANGTSNNQTILTLGIDACTTFTNQILNFIHVDEEQQTNITDGTIETSINIFNSIKSQNIINFSSSFEAVNPLAICLNINLTNGTSLLLDTAVKYESDEHAIEYYNIVNFTLDNESVLQNITLFDLNLSDTTDFQVTFKDSSFTVVEGALIQVNRQYVSENTFKTVEIPKTDSNGQTVAHLVQKDVVYNIIVIKGSKILGTFNNVIAFCEDATIGLCQLNLNAFLEGETPFNYNSDIGILFDFDYNQTSRILDFTFSTTGGSSAIINMQGVLLDLLGNTTVCNETLVSASGTLTCTFPASVGNSSVFIEVTVNNNKKIQEVIRLLDDVPYGTAGYLLMFILVITLPLMFSQSKTLMIAGVIVGFIISSLLSLFRGGILGFGSSIIWLIIAGMILIWRLNKGDRT